MPGDARPRALTAVRDGGRTVSSPRVKCDRRPEADAPASGYGNARMEGDPPAEPREVLILEGEGEMERLVASVLTAQ